MTVDDATLVARVRAGDQGAFAEVYDRYGPRLHAFCRRVLDDHHEAADVVQDTFVLAVQRLDQLRDPEALRAWLYAIARNECTKRGRARNRQRPTADVALVTGEATGLDGAALTGDDDAVAAGASAEETAALVWAAADGLDDRDRQLLVLNVRHGLEGEELALAAGIKSAQVATGVARMRERLDRSIGALLVARRGRRDCPELAGILAGWDGQLTVLLRKRVARHVDACRTCAAERRAAVVPLGSLAALPFVAPADLRRRVLDAVARAQGTPGGAPTSSATEPWPGGFPPPPPFAEEPDELDGADPDRGGDGPAPAGDGRRRSALVAAVVLVVLLLVGGGLALGRGGDGADGDTQLAAADRPTTTAIADRSTTSGTPRSGSTVPGATTTTATTALPPTTTTPIADPAPIDPGAGPTAPLPTAIAPATIPPPAPAPTQPPVTLSPPDQPPTVGTPAAATAGPLRTVGCAPPTTTTVAVAAADDRGLASVTLVWTQPGSGGSSGQRAMSPAGGGYQGTLGPFTVGGTVSYHVVARDTAGHVVASPTRTIAVDPCPG